MNGSEQESVSSGETFNFDIDVLYIDVNNIWVKHLLARSPCRKHFHNERYYAESVHWNKNSGPLVSSAAARWGGDNYGGSAGRAAGKQGQKTRE